MTDVAVVGIGSTAYRTATPEYSWKELMYEAAVKAYDDAGVNPRKDVDSFVTCSEDYWEGFGIFDEFVPDQIGAALRPTCTICGDGLHGIATAYMQIKTGLMDIVAVEAHSKASDILTYEGVVAHALDPIWNKPLGGHPYYVAGLEMNAYLSGNGVTERHCAEIAALNRRNGLRNDLAPHGMRVTPNDVMASKTLFSPLKRLEVSELADGAIVMVLASDEAVKRLDAHPVWVDGVGWASDSPWLETRDWKRAVFAELAAEKAYKLAGIGDPASDIDFAEVDDRFAYKELQHLEALGLAGENAEESVQEGRFTPDGDLPVNVSGGCLGAGNLLEASGLQKAYEVALQLRGEAGRHQLGEVETGVALGWRGVPTASGAVAVFRRG
jgi:acetyl-CoA C-acetyltransferase